MGGDLAPSETVAGAVEAARRGVDVVLVGRHDSLEIELSKLGTRLPIVDAADVVGMGDDPGRALREKPEASINVAARLVAEGSADGFVSAGSTGAAMAAAAILIGRIKGVSRPAIATIFPTPVTPTLVLDSGANLDVKPEQLAQFGIMGSVAVQALFGLEDPRVGLLSIGEEKGKGRDLERAAYDLLDAGPTNFVGNLEGRDIATDKADVIVTDGFTGNVFLKTTEGTSKLVTQYLLEALSKLSPDIQEQVFPVIAAVEEMLDYETYGGAQLLGVKSVAVIAHGSSSRVAISNALALARDSAEGDLPGRLAEQLP
ncbi:MAG: phosphate acyltransferase PlsX [Acidobacteria bacterium]|nr:phosphate acyltransferase PlsX [Acidobacteriota bacterium]TDI53289.1 MAG: phosphate acyltransferase PlsX [Acidobacteriota bacterium]TDI53381.1 MAG: phosphate acyltransferase PlsX [Acidobacteriota bacterium]TDI54931.1 MAG: phosphate acyltransferase PlsX [Acidobacteriota bacterium]